MFTYSFSELFNSVNVTIIWFRSLIHSYVCFISNRVIGKGADYGHIDQF